VRSEARLDCGVHVCAVCSVAASLLPYHLRKGQLPIDIFIAVSLNAQRAMYLIIYSESHKGRK